MKTLYLLRHAKSSWKDSSLSDRERPLNKRGKKQVQLLAQSPALNAMEGAKIFASDATRARQTISGVLAHSGLAAGVVYESALYTFDYLDLVHWLKGQQETKDLLIVGHNPALEGLIDYLAPDHIHDFPTGAWIQLTLNVEQWSQVSPFCGEVSAFLIPALLDHDEFQKRILNVDDLSSELADYPAVLETYRQPAMIGQDVEFLHQYRVFARKLRGLLKLVMPEDDAQAETLTVALQHLKDVIHLSNPIRDLDVFDVSLQAWQSSLNTDCKRGLLALRHHVAKDRATHYHLFNQYLNSELYAQRHDALNRSVAMAEWASDKCQLGLFHDAGDDDETMSVLAGDKQVFKQLKHKFDKHYDHISSNSDDSDFHHLRLHAKNYLNALALNPRDSKRQLKRLSVLKKHLGEIQDACVQQQQLLQYAAAEPANDHLLRVVEIVLHQLRKRKTRLKKAICEQ